jgi:hypothetical protein
VIKNSLDICSKNKNTLLGAKINFDRNRCTSAIHSFSDNYNISDVGLLKIIFQEALVAEWF